jgi:hypothetical protein
MNHLTHQLALSHQDDLLRAAANHRLVSQLSSAAVIAPSARARRAPRKRRLARLHRLLTRPARTSIVEPRSSIVERYPVLTG